MTILTYLQKVDIAKKHMADKKLSFGCREGDDNAIDLYIAGMDYREELYNNILKEFKDTYMRLFKFHCEEIIKRPF